MNRAIVIYGDREIGNAVADGMRAALPEPKPLEPEQVKVVQGEIDRQRIVAGLVRVAVGNSKTAQDYACMVAKARCDYGIPREHGRLYRAVWGLIGYLVLAVDGWAKYLSEWNRG